jgi:hypothetical protein
MIIFAFGFLGNYIINVGTIVKINDRENVNLDKRNEVQKTKKPHMSSRNQ